MPSRRKENDMELSIEYCGTCNYRPIAASLAMAIEKGTGIKSILVHSTKMGALEVKAGSELIFSKIQTGRFPDVPKLVEIIKGQK
jgi:selT/selW/selH-like putative selenoprotein